MYNKRMSNLCALSATALVCVAAAALPSASIAGVFPDGVNLQPSYYNNGNPTFDWSLMKAQTKIKTVRIEIEPAYVSQAKTWLANACSNGYTVIATYHNANALGSSNLSDLTAAGGWWQTNYAALRSAAGCAFTVNLMNEWGGHTISAANYASFYNTAISMVRKVYSGSIIIDIPGYGQETLTAAQASPSITDKNIIFSTHIYPTAYSDGTNEWLANSDLDTLGNAGRPVIVGEFGNGGSGSANWSGLVSHAKSKGWTVIAWCWNGDGGGMNMVTPSWATSPAATSFSLSSYFNVVYPYL